MKPSSGGGLFSNWWHCKSKKGPNNRKSMADPGPLPPSSSISVASNHDSPAASDKSTLIADAELTSKVRLILYTEFKHVVSESLMEMSRQILLPASNAESSRPANEAHAQLNSQQGVVGNKEQQLSKIKDLEMQLQESLQKQRVLQEEVEMLKPEQYVFTSGSFEEGAPSPPMLQEAHNAMQSALLTCAVKVNDQVKSLPVIRTYQKIFIRQLCDCFFIEFETSSFGGTQRNPSISIFQRPDKDLKRRLFKEYVDYRTENESKLFNTQLLFKAFCNSRFQLFIHNQNDRTPFTSPEQRESVLSKLVQKDEYPLFGDFVRLAKTVWLLHKLAFAFEPTAEIFRVNEGSLYDPDYMEARDGDPWPENTAKRGAAEVGFMAAPGFTVRNFIIKAQVHLRGGK